MPLFAISLLSECRVAGVLPPQPMHQVAIHLVKARDEMEARARGTEMGVGRQHAYRNGDGEEVFWAFRRVVECQDLADREFVDGMEVSC